MGTWRSKRRSRREDGRLKKEGEYLLVYHQHFANKSFFLISL